MREFITENLTNETTVTLAVVIVNNGIALAIAFFVMFAYRITYVGTAYSRKFNVSLGSIVITTTMVMSIISNNIALSLGMVGALSIIRFRTAIKDVRDAAFIFWAIAVGIGCGVSQYTLVGIGSVTLLLFMVLTKQAIESGQQLLVICGRAEAQNQMEAVVESHFGNAAHPTIKNMSGDKCELVYRVKENVLKKANEKNMIDISQRLMKVEGVERVNLVEQQEDISR